MNTSEKSKLIGQIIAELKIAAITAKDYSFCEGDMFFSLAFKTDKELMTISKLVGIK